MSYKFLDPQLIYLVEVLALSTGEGNIANFDGYGRETLSDGSIHFRFIDSINCATNDFYLLPDGSIE